MDNSVKDIFFEFEKLLPPTHQNPQKAVLEQILYNSSRKGSDMVVDQGDFKLPVDAIEKKDDTMNSETGKIPDQNDTSFFNVD